MSKYIDAERLNMEWQTLKPFGVTDTTIENLKWIVDRQPTIEVSEDCISREWLLKYITKGVGALADNTETLVDVIKNAPSVVPTTEQSSMVGEWKKEVNEKLGKCLRVIYVCSVCGCAVGCENFVRRSYCPNCGAKMKGASR